MQLQKVLKMTIHKSIMMVSHSKCDKMDVATYGIQDNLMKESSYHSKSRKSKISLDFNSEVLL